MGFSEYHFAVLIANYFIKKSDYGLDLMQVLKLSYIAHGFKLGPNMGPLANELAQAWQYDPVFPSIYHEFKYQRPGKIKDLGESDTTENFSNEEKEIMNIVYEIYGKFLGWELSLLTHADGTPWHNAYYKGKTPGKDFRGVPILNDEIQKYFKEEIIDKRS